MSFGRAAAAMMASGGGGGFLPPDIFTTSWGPGATDWDSWQNGSGGNPSGGSPPILQTGTVQGGFGSRALQVDFPVTVVTSNQIYRTLSGSYTDLYYRLYFRRTATVPPDINHKFARFYRSLGNSDAGLYHNYDRICFGFSNSSPGNVNSIVIASDYTINVWHWIEVHYQTDQGTVGPGGGRARFWFDGNPVVQPLGPAAGDPPQPSWSPEWVDPGSTGHPWLDSGVVTSDPDVTFVGTNINMNSGLSNAQTFFIDGVACSTTRIGP